jgi:hypothetical protein
LFLNASSYKLALQGNSGEPSYIRYFTIGSVFNFCIGFLFFKLIGINFGVLSLGKFKLLLLLPFIIHFSIHVLFSSDLKLVLNKYNKYYSKTLYIVYCGLVIIGMGTGVYCAFS